MRHAFLYALGLAVACGSTTEDAPVTQQVPIDGGGADTGRDAAKEQKITTFTCGGTGCVVGEHACCQVSGTFGCFSLEAGGCPMVDAGADAEAGPPPPPLLCATYNNCPGDKAKCCWTAEAGSSCVDGDSCPNGAVNLCTINTDSCGDKSSCDPLAGSPLPGVGMCVKQPD